jgi:hypothetical protein
MEIDDDAEKDTNVRGIQNGESLFNAKKDHTMGISENNSKKNEIGLRLGV